MQYLHPSTAATFSCYIFNFKLQTLQLHKLLIQKQLVALFAPISCNLEEEKTITSLGFDLNPGPFIPNPHALLIELSGMMKISVGNNVQMQIFL